MELWVIFAFFGALCSSISAIVDKFIMNKKVNFYVILMVYSLFCTFASIFIFLFIGTVSLSLSNILIAFLAGAIFPLANIFYFESVKVEEISRVSPLYYMYPLFVGILGGLFLNEALTSANYMGIVFLACGAVLISLKSFKTFSIGKSFWFMIITTFSVAISAVLIKCLLSFADYWTIFAYSRFGCFFVFLGLFWFHRKDFVNLFKQNNKKLALIISASEFTVLLGGFFVTIAMSLNYATPVIALTSIDPFLVLLFSVILTRFFPHIIKEEISKKILLLKFVAILMIFVGAVLIM